MSASTVAPTHLQVLEAEAESSPGRPAAGLAYVEWAAANVTKLWFAIGGLDTANVGAVSARGATRIVVVRAITDAADPAAAAGPAAA